MNHCSYQMRLIPLVLILTLGIIPHLSSSQKEKLTGKVMTVHGPVDPEVLGVTLPHEHLLIDARLPDESPQSWSDAGRRRPVTKEELNVYRAPLAMNLLGVVSMGTDNRDNWVLEDEGLAIKELREYRWYGGQSLVELTPKGKKRNPAALKRIADATGIHIVAGTAWAPRPWADESLSRLSVEALSGQLLDDLLRGEGGGVRAGIIGELCPGDPVSETDRRMLRAAARAGRQSGAAISLTLAHAKYPVEEAERILDILAAAGADLSRVALGHADLLAKDIPGMVRLLKRGVFLQFDRLGDWPSVKTLVSDHDVAVALIELIKSGYSRQLLISQNVCTKIDLKAYAGSGYAFITEQYHPYLRNLGLSDDQFRQISVENPRRLLTLAAPKGGEK